MLDAEIPPFINEAFEAASVTHEQYELLLADG